jgi:glycosyltransferase involved in cell wall biosynthesis
MKKVSIIIKGFAKRLGSLWTARDYDFVFIHRELSPVGPPLFEWILATLFRKKIIYDFDDAIWLTDRDDETTLVKLLRWRSKVKVVCRLAYKVSAGNHYLGDFARQVNKNVVLNPTTIYTQQIRQKVKPDSTRIIIGWTGSHSTLKYLNLIESVLQRIEEKYNNVDFLVIADRPSTLNLQRLSFWKWNLETEIEDLQKIDIGVMPLPDDEWTRGKCGFKILQYMALAIPSIASAVGVNTEIIISGKNGFLCNSEKEWLTAIEDLLTNDNLRRSIGEAGKQLVQDSYSEVSNCSNFIALFK